MAGLFEELKRRNVFKVSAAYVVASWVLLQFVDLIVPILELPEWTSRLVLVLLVIGFVPALIFAWAYELTPEGLKREAEVDRSQSITSQTGRKIDFVIIALLTIALVGIAGNWHLNRDDRWVRDEALPELQKLADADNWEAAFKLASRIEEIAPDDPSLADMRDLYSMVVTIPSDPSGADVYRRPYSSSNDDWEFLGVTPLNKMRIPFGLSLLRLEYEDREPLLRVIGIDFPTTSELEVRDKRQLAAGRIFPRYSRSTIPARYLMVLSGFRAGMRKSMCFKAELLLVRIPKQWNSRISLSVATK